MLVFGPMTDEAAEAVATWSYDAPYTVYNHRHARRASVVRGLLDPAHGYEAIFEAELGLVAFCCAGPDARVAGGAYEDEAIDIGVGLRPDLTGQGRGGRLVSAVAKRVAITHPSLRMRVTIAGFNTRARRVWGKLGFEMASSFRRPTDGIEFVVMVSVGPA